MNTNRTFRITKPHVDTDLDYHEWVWIGLNMLRGDRIGRKHPHGWTDWLILVCNNPDCSGRALLQPEAAANFIEAAATMPMPLNPVR